MQEQCGCLAQPLFKRVGSSPAPSRPAAPGELNPCVQKLRSGDLSGPELNPEQYIQLNDEPVISNARCSETYRQICFEEEGLGPEPDCVRYGHFKRPDDFDLMRWVVRRALVFGNKNTPRTRVRKFKHRLITQGPPVRMGLHRLNRPDTEWVEKVSRMMWPMASW